MLWVILAMMLLVAVAALALPLLSRAESEPHETVTEVLKSQLADVTQQKEAGRYSGEEAEALSTEIKRRLLAEGRAVEADLAQPSIRPWLAAVIALVVVTGAVWLYRLAGHPELGSQPTREASSTVLQQPAMASLIDKLQAHLARAPRDHEGWSLLGSALLMAGHNREAVNAYARAIALAPTNAADLSSQGDALARAAGGQVTPAALADFRAALVRDPKEARARYYVGLWKEQNGDHVGAMAAWIALLKNAPPDAPWVFPVREFVERDARAHGEDVSSQLGQGGASAPGTSVPDPAQRQHAQIENMVESLALRLKSHPRDEAGWMELMRARMVLGEKGAAAQAYFDARSAFSDSAATQVRLRDTARVLAVPGA